MSFGSKFRLSFRPACCPLRVRRRRRRLPVIRWTLSRSFPETKGRREPAAQTSLGVARLLFAQSASDGVRAASCADLTRDDAVPMHRLHWVGPRDACAARPGRAWRTQYRRSRLHECGRRVRCARRRHRVGDADGAPRRRLPGRCRSASPGAWTRLDIRRSARAHTPSRGGSRWEPMSRDGILGGARTRRDPAVAARLVRVR